MCVTAILDDTWIYNIRGLRAVLDEVVIENEEELREAVRAQGGDMENTCLCIVDMEATAAANQMEWVWPAYDGGDPMEGRLVRVKT